MFSVTTACAFSDEEENTEAAEAAGRYYAQYPRRPRSNTTRITRPNKVTSTVAKRGGATSNLVAHLHRSALAAALLDVDLEKQCVHDESDVTDAHSCSSILNLRRPICCKPRVNRSYSNEDSTMFTFLEPQGRSQVNIFENKDYLQVPLSRSRQASTSSESRANFTNRNRSLSNAQPMSSSELETGNLAQHRSAAMLLELDTPDASKHNTATVTTNASNGGVNDTDRLSNQTQTPLSPSFDIVTINVSGIRFQTYASTLERFPDTLLGDPMKRSLYFNTKIGEYFFDRHRGSFDAIIYYYQSNGKKLCRPESVPPDIFLRELQFFEMGPDVIDKFLESQGCVRPKELELPKRNWQRKLWLLMEYPDSSLYARIFAFASVGVIVLSTLSFCLETIPALKCKKNSTVDNETGTATGDRAEESGESFDCVFFIIELSCMCWFTLEFTFRFISCPSKLEFCKSVLNIIDFVAIVPFFVTLGMQPAKGNSGSAPPFAVLRIFRLVRVFRIFKLSRHSRGLQILGKTFTASVQELCLLIFFLVLGLVLFSSAVYIAEYGQDSGFESIPHSFWYVIVTMTTVGYGDLTPKGPWGKLVGGMCAIVGVLVLALPVPVIVANFKHYYRQEARLARMRAAQGEGMSDDELCEDDDSRSS